MSEACDESHERIEAAIAGVDAKLEYHVGETHAALAAAVATGDGALAEDIGQITDALLGPTRTYGMHAGTRDETKGIEHKVNAMWEQTQNGGVQAHLSRGDAAKLWAAVLAGLATVLIDLLNRIP